MRDVGAAIRFQSHAHTHTPLLSLVRWGPRFHVVLGQLFFPPPALFPQHLANQQKYHAVHAESSLASPPLLYSRTPYCRSHRKNSSQIQSILVVLVHLAPRSATVSPRPVLSLHLNICRAGSGEEKSDFYKPKIDAGSDQVICGSVWF